MNNYIGVDNFTYQMNYKKYFYIPVFYVRNREKIFTHLRVFLRINIISHLCK